MLHNLRYKMPSGVYIRTEEHRKKIRYISWLCFLITLIALRVIYCRLTNKPMGGFTPYIIGIGFPLLFNLTKGMIRNAVISICVLAALITQQWISLFCVSLTFLIMLSKHYKIIAILLLIALLCFGVSALKVFPGYEQWNWALNSLQGRIVFYSTLIRNWDNIWLGEGFDKFKTLPENQPQNNPYHLWLHDAHSDLLQGFYEFGIIGMIPILFIVLLPLFFVKLDTLFNLTVFISYLCVLFQGLIDFPFHRWTTGLLSLIIVCLMYYITSDEIVAFFRVKR